LNFFIIEIAEHWDRFLLLLKNSYEERKNLGKKKLPKGEFVKKEEVEKMLESLCILMSKFLNLDIKFPNITYHPYLSALRNKMRMLLLGIFLALLGVCAVVVYFEKIGRLSFNEAYYVSIPVLMAFVFLFSLYRRLKICLEHGSFYMEDEEGPKIIIFDLPKGRFLSYALHELAFYASSLYRVRNDAFREGWARALQLKLSRSLTSEGIDTLSAVLDLTIERLKVAAYLVSKSKKLKLPFWVKRIKVRSRPPFGFFFSYKKDLTSEDKVHALATAYFLLLENKFGDEVYREFLEKRVDERWPFIAENYEAEGG